MTEETEQNYQKNQIGIRYNRTTDSDKLKAQLKGIGFRIQEYKFIDDYLIAFLDAEPAKGFAELEQIIIENISGTENLKLEPITQKRIL